MHFASGVPRMKFKDFRSDHRENVRSADAGKMKRGKQEVLPCRTISFLVDSTPLPSKKRPSASLLGISCAAKSDVFRPIVGAGEKPFRRRDPFRRIEAPAAADDSASSAIGSLRIAHVSVCETLRIPV